MRQDPGAFKLNQTGRRQKLELGGEWLVGLARAGTTTQAGVLRLTRPSDWRLGMSRDEGPQHKSRTDSNGLAVEQLLAPLARSSLGCCPCLLSHVDVGVV